MANRMRIWRKGAASGIGFVLLAFLTAASQKVGDQDPAQGKDPAADKSSTSSLEEELQSFEQQLGAPSSAESLFANGRAPDLVVMSSTDVHGEIEPCG